MSRATVENVDAAELVTRARQLIDEGSRLALVAAHHDSEMRVVYLFTSGPPDRRVELHFVTDAAKPVVPSMASFSFPAGRFEREMHDLFGIIPERHPLPRPLVAHPNWSAGWHPMRHDAGPRPPLTAAQPFPFLTVEGDGVYEIPVGPVHAGLIEPGHFRFYVVGETILKLKARLWYVHKGLENLFVGRSLGDGVALAERVSGDTAVGHGLAYALAAEDAIDLVVPVEAQRVRAVLLELERLHNHVADIGALCNDVAYGIAHAHAQRIRERLLRLNQATTQHRLLRGGVFPGGAQLQAVPSVREIAAIEADVAEIVEIALGHGVVRERFTGTAVLSRQSAHELGTLGYVARASGLTLDARIAHPFFDLGDTFRVPAQAEGDVLARFQQRAQEVRISAAVLADLLPSVAAGEIGKPATVSAAQRLSGCGIVEGWRGTIVHRVEIEPNGTLSRVKIVDPSFFNWPALPVALADTIVPDFPLANKSFNLSYAGNDL